MQGDVLMMQEPIAYRTPVYPWFLAACRKVALEQPLWLISILQGTLYVGSVYLAARISLRITKIPRSQTLTAIFMIPAVAAAQYTTAILSETLFVFLLLLHLLSLLNYANSPTKWRIAWSAITFAICVLTRPIVQLIWIAHLGLLIYFAIRRKRINKLQEIRFYKTRHAGIAICIILFICSPFLVRNYLLFGKPFLTEFIGRNLWIVTFQDGSGSNLPMPSTPASDELQKRVTLVNSPVDLRSTWSVSNQLVQSGLNDAAADGLMKQVAVEAISDNRMAFAKKTARRIINYWRCANTTTLRQGDPDQDYHSQTTWMHPIEPMKVWLENRFSQSVIGNTLLTCGLALALIYLLQNPLTRPYALWLGLIFSYFSVVTGIFEIPDYRYRFVLEPLIASSFGSSLAILLSQRRREAKLV